MTVFAALLLLIPLPLVSAQTMDALGVDAIDTHGATALHGGLTALRSYSQAGADGPWTVSASQVQVKGHYYDYAAQAPLVDIGGTPGESETETIEDPRSILVSLHGSSDFWVRAGTTTVSFQDIRDSRIAATQDPFEFPDRLGGRAPWPSMDISESVSITPDTLEGSVHLNGDIELLLWNTDLEVDGETYWSGQGTEPVVDEEGTPDTVGTSRRQVLQVWLTDAAIDVPLADLSEVEVALSSGSLSGTDAVEMSNPRRLVDDGLLGESLRIEGDWGLDIGRMDDSVVVQGLEGDSARLDGRSYALDPSAGLSPWWWLLLLVPSAALYLAMRPPAPVLLDRLERRLDQRDYEGVAATSIKRLLRTKKSAKASLYRSTALLAMGAFQEASLFLASLARDQRPDPATYHFLAAHAAAGLGNKDTAKEHLRDCFALAPSYRQEALCIPILQNVLQTGHGTDPDEFEFV